MKLQSKTILSPVSQNTLKSLTAIVDETMAHAPVVSAKRNTISAAQVDRILKGRRVFRTRRFIYG